MKTKVTLLCFTFFVFSCGEKDADDNNNAASSDCNELYPVDTSHATWLLFFKQ